MTQNTSHAVMAQRIEPHQIISLRDARARGLLRYFTGVPCPKGHTEERSVSSRGCLACFRVAANPKKQAKERERYVAHADEIKTRVRDRWRTDPKAKELDKKSRDARREKIRAYDRMRAKRDREKKTIIIDRWIAANPERYKAISVASAQRRRARIKAAPGKLTADDIQKAVTSQQGKCWWCSKKISGSYHVDHRFPVSKGGANDASNVVISCATCNRSKSAKMPWEFSGRLL